MTYTDDILIKALKNGDKKAFTWKYNKYFHQLCIYAEKIVGNTEIAKDIVHDLFAKLWENHEKIDITTSLKEYLYGSIRNACLKHLEHIKVRQKHYDSFMKENREACDNNNPMHMLIEKETANELKRIINGLPKQCREVLVLWEDGLKYKEVAEKLGIALATVRTQITRAKNKLKKSLENLE